MFTSKSSYTHCTNKTEESAPFLHNTFLLASVGRPVADARTSAEKISTLFSSEKDVFIIEQCSPRSMFFAIIFGEVALWTTVNSKMVFITKGSCIHFLFMKRVNWRRLYTFWWLLACDITTITGMFRLLTISHQISWKCSRFFIVWCCKFAQNLVSEMEWNRMDSWYSFIFNSWSYFPLYRMVFP